MKGVVAYYKDFLEALFDHLAGQASVTGAIYSIDFLVFYFPPNNALFFSCTVKSLLAYCIVCLYYNILSNCLLLRCS